MAPPEADRDAVREFGRAFGAELDARGVSLRKAAEQSGWSKSAIANARSGSSLPREQLVTDVLTAIGLDPEEIRTWRDRHRSVSGAGPAAPGPDAGTPRRRPSRRVVVSLVAAAVVVAIAIAAALTVWGARTDARADPAPASHAVITVQNKVALGAAELVEDSSPAYLSGEPVSFCSRRGCRLEGTDMASGALVVGVCRATGEKMWNYNLDSPAPDNPHRAASDLWYRIAWPDGRYGYLAEIYVEPASRGGLGLAECAP